MVDQLWEVVIPSATTNLCLNPSFELSGTASGWYPSGSNTIARSSAQAFRGGYSELITYQDAISTLAYYNPGINYTVGGTYFVSAWVYVPSTWDGGNIRVNVGVDIAGATQVYNHIYTHGTSPTNAWVYLETKITFGADVAGSVGIGATSAPTAGRTVYLDAFQIEERSDFATTYCDGEQKDCYWNGTAHGSTSTRSALTRAGGRVVNLGDYGLKVRFNDGIGLSQSQHQTQSLANLPGANFKGRKVLPRVLTLTAVAPGTSAANLHSIRKDLLEALNPDGVPDDQPVILRYTGASSSKPVEIRATYDTGMGFEARFKVEEFALRLIAYDPFFYELSEGFAALTLSESVTNGAHVVVRDSGDWGPLGTGLNLLANASALDSSGNLYVGGAFTTAGGVACNYIAKWDGSVWAAMGAGPGFDAQVNALLVNNLDQVWAGGAFRRNSGGVLDELARIAYWTGAAWAEPGGAGFNNTVSALAMDLTGSIYVGGAFTTNDAGAVTFNCIAKWNGAAWVAVGAAPGLNNPVTALAVGPDNSVYIGGGFTDISGGPGGTYNYIIKWSGSAFSALGSGFDAQVNALAVGPDGSLYAGGTFTTADGAAASKIAKWNGAAWEPLGNGVDNTVLALGFDQDGILWVSGSFTSAGGIACTGLALWNGSTWAAAPFNRAGANAYGFEYKNNKYYLVGNFTAPPLASGITTVTNGGSARAYPKFVFKRSGGTSAVVYWLKNETTGATIHLNYSLLNGETLTIDLSQDNRSVVSSVFGNVIGRAILRGSDLADFYLLPGSNSISTFVLTAGAPTMTGYISYPITHSSADGAAA
jgi:hypothetical protein